MQPLYCQSENTDGKHAPCENNESVCQLKTWNWKEWAWNRRQNLKRRKGQIAVLMSWTNQCDLWSIVNKELIFFQRFHCFVCIFHFTQSCLDSKIFIVDLLLLVCRLLGSKVRETPTVFPTILSFPGIPPCISTASVLSRRRGRSESRETEKRSLFVVRRNYAAILDLISTLWPRTMGSTQACDRAASQFMFGKSPLSVVSPRKPAISIFPQSWNNEFLYRLLNPSSLHSLEGKVPLPLRH